MNDWGERVWTGTEYRELDDPASKFPEKTVRTADPYIHELLYDNRRFVSAASEMLIFTGGSCLNNHTTESPRHSSYGFVLNSSHSGIISSEAQGLNDRSSACTETNSRAELLAVIAALQYRDWWLEGWKRIVIAADSEYLCKGATNWLRDWPNRGWLTAKNKPVANQDLWKCLSEVLGSYAKKGCEVSFWKVEKEVNFLAHLAAQIKVTKAEEE
ncbi:ribonuclease H-like domain-containing protein [Hypomontagnella monticulosa]|nr:ribonuclease H-like domain-containing protein [Hypomontagnella monticulosa]